MFKKQSLVLLLRELGFEDEAEHAKTQDIDEKTNELIAQIAEYGSGEAVAERGEGEPEKKLVQYDRVRDHFALEYDQALRKATERASKSKTDSVVVEPTKAQIEQVHETADKAAAEALAAAALAIEQKAIAEPERILDQIDDYRKRFFGEEQENGFETDFKTLEDSQAAGKRRKASSEEVIKVKSEKARLSFRLENDNDVVSTPLGDFEKPGSIRPPVVKLELRGENLDYGVYPVAQRELLTLLRGVSAIEIDAPRKVEKTRQRICRWLQDANIHVLSDVAQNDALGNKSWAGAAGRVRSSILVLRHWHKRLSSELAAIATWRNFLGRRDAELSRTQPPELTGVMKRILTDLDAEFALFQSSLAREFDTAFQRLEKKVSWRVSSLGPDHIKEGELDGDPKKRTLSVVSSKLDDLFFLNSSEVLDELGDVLQKRFEETWSMFLYPRLVRRQLLPSVGDLSVDERAEVMVSPVSSDRFKEIVDSELAKAKQSVSGDQYFATTMKSPSIGQALAQTARVPSRLLAPFAGIFALTMIFGLGGRGLVKDAAGQVIDTVGVSTNGLIAILAALMVSFLGFVYLDANNQRNHDKTRFVVDAKKKIALAHERALEGIRKEFNAEFRSKLKSSIADVLRRISTNVELKAQGMQETWSSDRTVNRKVDQALERQSAELGRILTSISKSEERLNKCLSDVRSMAELKGV
ncbi:hypothetical protein [Ruegeria arenilitoris]|uniref:hypothetical protein n=1 Tax=Ruegeria arenilitoris TaxID=1173585 RepID=UPI00147FE2F8|nr:hypothetical protein [Ruegeria arenilitoris]